MKMTDLISRVVNSVMLWTLLMSMILGLPR